MASDTNKMKIVEAAAGRFEHFGYKKTTVEEIASDAGISKGAIYLHFNTKEDILLEVVHQAVLDHLKEWRMIAAKDIPSRDKIDEMFCYWVEAVLERKGKYFGGDHLEMQLMKEAHEKFLSTIRPLVVDTLVETIRNEVKSGGMKDDVVPEEIASLIALQIYSAIHLPEKLRNEWKMMWGFFWKYLGDSICL